MLGPYLELMLQFTAAITLPNVVRRTAFDAIVVVVPPRFRLRSSFFVLLFRFRFFFFFAFDADAGNPVFTQAAGDD